MSTYVTSLRPHARLTHVGDERGTACGTRFARSFVVTKHPAPDRQVCGRCLAALAVRAEVQRLGELSAAHRDALLVSLYRDGASDAAVARRLHAAPRTLSRYVSDAMRRAGARSRFQWGFIAGFAAGKKSA